MDWKNYNYPTSGEYEGEPVVTVTVSFGGNSIVDLAALVDSGAQATSMDIGIAKALGIGLPKDSNIFMDGYSESEESAKAYPALCEIKISKQKAVTSYVLFTEKQKKKFPIILGHRDFFENFDVRFEKRNSLFSLKIAPQRGVDSQ